MNKRIMRMIGIILIGTSPVWGIGEGDPAPALNIAEWIQGPAVADVGQPSDHVHLMLFWASWSRPATESLETLSKMSTDFASDKVLAIAISTESVQEVKTYLSSKNFNRGLRIAVDDQQQTSSAYMHASGHHALPHLFIIDREGKIAWQGHPADARPILEKVLDGTFEVTRSTDVDDSEDAEIDPALQQALQQTFAAKQWPQALSAIDEVLRRYPNTNTAAVLRGEKLTILYERLQDYTTAEDYALQLLASHPEDPQIMNQLAWVLLARGDFEKLDNRWPEMAHRAALNAYQASKGEEAAIIDTYARSMYMLGNLDKALELQKQALKKTREEYSDAQADPEMTPEFLAQMKSGILELELTLKYYEDLVATREQLK